MCSARFPSANYRLPFKQPLMHYTGCLWLQVVANKIYFVIICLLFWLCYGIVIQAITLVENSVKGHFTQQPGC